MSQYFELGESDTSIVVRLLEFGFVAEDGVMPKPVQQPPKRLQQGLLSHPVSKSFKMDNSSSRSGKSVPMSALKILFPRDISREIRRRRSWEEMRKPAGNATWTQKIAEQRKQCQEISSTCHFVVLAHRLKLMRQMRECHDLQMKQQHIRQKNNILATVLEDLCLKAELERRPPEESRLGGMAEELQDRVTELNEDINIVENFLLAEEEDSV